MAMTHRNAGRAPPASPLMSRVITPHDYNGLALSRMVNGGCSGYRKVTRNADRANGAGNVIGRRFGRDIGANILINCHVAYHGGESASSPSRLCLI